MKGWMRAMALAAVIVALVWAVSRGQETPDCGAPVPMPGEPPMVDAPMTPRNADSPRPPFTPPPPTPLPPEQIAPFAPAAPFVPTELREPPMPIVRLRVQAPASSEPDKEIEYRLTVENVSRADAHHVLLRDRLPRGMEKDFRAEPKPTRQTKSKKDLTDLLWEIGTLKAGEHKIIVLAIKPQGAEDVPNSAFVQYEHGQTVKTRISKPGLRLKATAPAQAILYESIPFHIDITNTGTAPLRNVVLTDELPTGLEFVSGKPEPKPEKPLTWKLGDLLPHQTRRIDYQVISKQTGTLRNKAKVTAAGGVSATDSAAVTVGKAEVKIDTSGPARRLVHRPIPYHITVRNLGTVPLTNVQVSDELPRERGVEFLHASLGGRREGGFVRWSLGTLPPGEQRTMLMILRVSESGRMWNAATVRADHDLSAKAISEVTYIHAPSTPAIEIDKETDSLRVGQKASYTIRLFNPGKKRIMNLHVVAVVPEEMSILTQRGATTAQREGQTIRFDPLDALEGGEEKVYTIEAEAKKAGKADLRVRWMEGVQDTAPLQWWEDRTIILDPGQPTTSDIAPGSPGVEPTPGKPGAI